MSDSSNRKDYQSDFDITEDSYEDQLVRYKGKYTAERLMMMLDKDRLEALEEEFSEHPDGIELHNFIWLMKCAMLVEPEEKADLVLGLYYLFQDIDINGDQHMEWSEFTQYIIDAVMNAKERADNKDISPAEIMELALSHKSKRYHLSKLIDRTFHEGLLKYVNYYPVMDQISVIEVGSDSVKFFNMNSEIKQIITPKFKSPAFVLSMAYSEKEYLMVISCSDRKFYLYEKDSNSFRPGLVFQAPSINLVIWYFESHAVWASMSEDFSFKIWNMKTCEEIFVFKGHDQIILDAVEVRNPHSIATASLDGSIILWDLYDKKPLGSLVGRHSRGVRGVDYTPDYGGNIFSVGYERDIHMWSPEVTLSKCYAGKLEGHNCPVIACKVFKGRPICISIDERANIRVWDFRFQTCLQIITHDKGKIEVSKLLLLQKYDKFIVAGRRLVWYEQSKENNGKDGFKDVNPIYVDFNTYFFQFYVLTKRDLRIYDCQTGRLKKIYNDIQDSKTESELSAIVMDFRNRIFFVGDNSGSIRGYNCANGLLMKKLNNDNKQNFFNESEEEEEEPVKKSEGWNSEISGLYYVNDDKILIASSWDSNINVYDLMDVEEASLLRIMKGGHQGSDITCITYSEYLSVIASASSNGIVSVWDYQLGKLKSACFGHRKEVSSMTFIDPYPVLVTFSLDGAFCVWHLDFSGAKNSLCCIARFKNQSWTGSKDEYSAVSVSCILTSTCKAIPRVGRKRFIKQKRTEKNKNFFKTGEKVDSDNESEFEWVEEGPQLVEASPDTSEKNRTYLYIGDSLGYLKVLSLEELLIDSKIAPLTQMEKNKSNYNPRRKDIKNAESDIKYWRKEADGQYMPQVQDIENVILVKEWKAHTDNINCIRPIQDPKSLLSCSSDKHVKLWSREGIIWGSINLTSPEIPKKWYFPYDWEGKKQSDIKKITEVLALIDDVSDLDSKNIISNQKTPMKKKLKVKQEQRFDKVLEPVVKKKPTTHFYDIESLDEDDEAEKNTASLKKTYGHSTELQKKLDEMDEERNANYEETNSEIIKRHSRSKNRFENEKKAKGSVNKLPRIASVKVKRDEGLNKVASRVSFVKENNSKLRERKKPIANMRSTGLLKQLSNKKFKIKKEVNFDVRYQPGESIRVLNRAISGHNIINSSVLSPYTEDIKTLKKKHKIIKELVQRNIKK